MPLKSALGRQKQADLCEFKPTLLYRVNSRTAKATQKDPAKNNTLSCACGAVKMGKVSWSLNCPEAPQSPTGPEVA